MNVNLNDTGFVICETRSWESSETMIRVGGMERNKSLGSFVCRWLGLPAVFSYVGSIIVFIYVLWDDFSTKTL